MQCSVGTSTRPSVALLLPAVLTASTPVVQRSTLVEEAEGHQECIEQVGRAVEAAGEGLFWVDKGT